MKSSNVHLVSGENLNGRYRIDHSIGQGGYGEVVAAYDLREKRRVAIKILHDEVRLTDPNALARMRQEAEILRSIQHRNIVTVYSIEDYAEGAFLVMELVEGLSIAQVLTENGPISPERVLPLVHQILSALRRAHDQQILHRDIKPDNILLCDAKDDVPEHIKLVDFGIAKALAPLSSQDGDTVTQVKTRVGDVIGTPRYAAPEQVVGDPTGPGADLFSVGLVIAEWLTGTPRVKPGHYGAVMAQLVVPTPFDVSDCPAAWQAWLLGMMDKTPNGRFSSADQAIEELQAQVPWSGFSLYYAEHSADDHSSEDYSSDDHSSDDHSAEDGQPYDNETNDTLVETRMFVPSDRLRIGFIPSAQVVNNARLQHVERGSGSRDTEKKARSFVGWGMLFVMVGLISCLLLFIIYRVITG